MLDEWMTEEETAAEVGKTVRTIRKWRQKRVGPPFAYFGRTVKYHRPTFQEHFKSSQVLLVRGRPRNPNFFGMK